MKPKNVLTILLTVGLLLNFRTMAQKTVQVEQSIYINVPKDSLWKITALAYEKIGDWSAGVKSSEGGSIGGFNGEIYTERVCVPGYKGFKKTSERIIDYQPEEYLFTYQIAEGLPNMVKYATNTWTHEEERNGTRITMQASMELQGFIGTIMKGPMKRKMSKILRENLEELKVYAETGELHERKKRLNQKASARP
ncbi:MAG: SRPBCC family protein [Bacteroidota bacterium]